MASRPGTRSWRWTARPRRPWTWLRLRVGSRASREAPYASPCDGGRMSAPAGSSDGDFSEREVARGRWLVFGATFFWGTSATLARFVFRDRHVPALTAVELRLVIACALLGPWLAWRRPSALRVPRSDWGYFLV